MLPLWSCRFLSLSSSRSSKPPPADTKKVIINHRILKPCGWIARLAKKFEMIDFWFQTYNNMSWPAHQKQWNFGLGLAGLPIIDWTMPIKSVIHEFMGRHGLTLFWCFSQSKWALFQSTNGSVTFQIGSLDSIHISLQSIWYEKDSAGLINSQHICELLNPIV